MARYLVTGGAGFIGSHLVEELLRRGEQVRVADNFSTGRRANLDAAAAAAGAEVPPVVEGDLADAGVAAAAVAGVDYVLHQAAIPSVPRSVNDPSARTGPTSTPRCTCWWRPATPASRRVVFAGSSSVYGDAAELPKHEAMPTRPAVALRAAEGRPASSTCKLFTTLYGLDTVTTRYFNVFGPRQDPVVAVLGRDLAVHPRRARRHARR